jgi:hypothetical protein
MFCLRFFVICISMFFFSHGNLHGIERNRVLEKIKQVPEWVCDEINTKFRKFEERGITQNCLNETFKKILETPGSPPINRYRIIHGLLFRKSNKEAGRLSNFEHALAELHSIHPLPDLDFFVCLQDGLPESYNPKNFWITADSKNQSPILAGATLKSAEFVILIPDVLTFDLWEKTAQKINDFYEYFPWHFKREIAFWRGSSSDKGYNWHNYETKPRFILSRLSQEYPNNIDAGFTSIYNIYGEGLREQIINLGLEKPCVSQESHLEYKYLPVLDGFMCTYPGYLWRLLGGSLCLKQDSEEVQYFYSALKPYIHYIPIKNDMSDLIEKIIWARENDEECKTIADQARRFCLNNLMIEDVYAYFYSVLEKYSSMQRFSFKRLIQSTRKDPKWKFVRNLNK